MFINAFGILVRMGLKSEVYCKVWRFAFAIIDKLKKKKKKN